MINGSIFPFLSQVLNPKKKGKKKKKYQNSGTVRQRLAVYGVTMADGVYSVQTLIDRSPSCLAWWTLNSPSWTTYEGGKSSGAEDVYLSVLRQITSCSMTRCCLLSIVLPYNLTRLMLPRSSSHDLFLLVGRRLISRWRSISQHQMVSVLKLCAYQPLFLSASG